MLLCWLSFGLDCYIWVCVCVCVCFNIVDCIWSGGFVVRERVRGSGDRYVGVGGLWGLLRIGWRRSSSSRDLIWGFGFFVICGIIFGGGGWFFLCWVFGIGRVVD